MDGNLLARGEGKTTWPGAYTNAVPEKPHREHSDPKAKKDRDLRTTNNRRPRMGSRSNRSSTNAPMQREHCTASGAAIIGATSRLSTHTVWRRYTSAYTAETGNVYWSAPARATLLPIKGSALETRDGDSLKAGERCARMTHLASFGSIQEAIRAALFGTPKKAERPTYDPELSVEENIRLQLEWVTGAPVVLKTRGRDAFIFDLRKPADRIARIAIRSDVNAQIVMDKEKEFSDWVRQEFPDDLNRFALVEDSYKIFLDDPQGRDVHEELESNKGNLTQNLALLSGFSPKFMARAWLRILKPVVLVYGRRRLIHGDIKADNVLVDLTPDGDYAFRMADWGGHYDPVNPRPPYEGTAMFQTKETLETGNLRPGDDVRGLQLTFLEMHAGECMPRLVELYPEAFEMIPHHGRDVPYLKAIPASLRERIPDPLFKILSTSFENVSDLQRALTEIYLSLEH
ncbi:MAG TPA: hypothetical protein VFE62_19725 [Gemmataceae bacterium]|nr:hypothetical protein [Gemmataceae bacterium]